MGAFLMGVRGLVGASEGAAEVEAESDERSSSGDRPGLREGKTSGDSWEGDLTGVGSGARGLSFPGPSVVLLLLRRSLAGPGAGVMPGAL